MDSEFYHDIISAMLSKGVKEVSVALQITPQPHSFEFGPAQSRHKVYYSDLEDLKARLKTVIEAEAYLAQLRAAQPQEAKA